MHTPRLARILRMLASAIAALCVVLFALAAYLSSLAWSLPDLRVDSATFIPARTSIVYAADDSVLAEWHGEQDRTVIPYAKIPQKMRDATVAIEDERFYLHRGVDTRAIFRALKANSESGSVRQGGSTITQQVVKLLFTDGERTIARKVKEALMAYQLEARSDKQQVLETYLNLVYFGEGSYGVESASNKYFGKHATDLTLSESALLAGIIQSPTRYCPTQDPVAAKKRRDVVLGKMRELGYITATAETAARAEKITIVPPVDTPAVAPYFVEYIKQTLIASLGSEAVYQGGLRVYTTLEPALQIRAETAARSLLSAKGDPSVAVVSLDYSNGEILAMVGGTDFRKDQFNLAVQGRRQPGSAFKPFVLVTALGQGVRPTDVFSATPYSVKVIDGIWNVQNYENGVTSGSMTLSAATDWSVNAVYARLIMKVGPANVVKTAKAMGITTPLDPNPAIALGGLKIGVSPLEMASAYGTIASGGVTHVPTGLVKVTDDQDKLIYEPDTSGVRAIDNAVAKQASLMLHNVVQQGTGQAARLNTWTAGKTGTTQAYRDAWFVGYSNNICTSVWVGHPQGQVSMNNVHGIRVTGGSYPAKIWKSYMEYAVTARASAPSGPAASANPSSETTSVTICTDTFLLANSRCPNTVEIDLRPLDVPRAVCREH